MTAVRQPIRRIPAGAVRPRADPAVRGGDDVPAAVPRVLRVVDALPLRGIGKPDRGAVARLLAAVTPPRSGV